MSYLIRKIKDRDSLETTCGLMRNLTTKEDFEKVDFAHFVISGETREHYHKELTEVYYVLKGRLAVEIDGKVEKLEKGSLIMIHPSTKHKAYNIGEEAEILVICSPPWSEEDEILSE